MEKRDIQAVFGIALLYMLLEIVGITCPILFITGVSCAGCGMSRAWLSLLRLDVAAALSYHPLFWLPVPAVLIWFFRKRLPEKVYKGFIIVFCALFLAVYGFRMLSPEDTIVVFDPAHGLIGRILSGIAGLNT